ncbi:MAG: hypothetical protein K2X93_17275 [Candidatus Obscuribacterales bacterium]|nr:hypothetical protein [Candidatus Obscuribacterales bacterium]
MSVMQGDLTARGDIFNESLLVASDSIIEGALQTAYPVMIGALQAEALRLDVGTLAANLAFVDEGVLEVPVHVVGPDILISLGGDFILAYNTAGDVVLAQRGS